MYFPSTRETSLFHLHWPPVGFLIPPAKGCPPDGLCKSILSSTPHAPASFTPCTYVSLLFSGDSLTFPYLPTPTQTQRVMIVTVRDRQSFLLFVLDLPPGRWGSGSSAKGERARLASSQPVPALLQIPAGIFHPFRGEHAPPILRLKRWGIPKRPAGQWDAAEPLTPRRRKQQRRPLPSSVPGSSPAQQSPSVGLQDGPQAGSLSSPRAFSCLHYGDTS